MTNGLDKGDSFEVTVMPVKETKKTYRCEEIGADGKPVGFGEGLVGTIYVKKDLFKTKPERLSVSIKIY